MTQTPIDDAIDSLASDEITEDIDRTMDLLDQEMVPIPISLRFIESGDLPYLQTVYQQHAVAMQKLQEAQQHEQLAQQARAEAQALAGAHDSYMRHLFTKYNLSPEDRIEQDGRIRRGAPQTEGR